MGCNSSTLQASPAGRASRRPSQPFPINLMYCPSIKGTLTQHGLGSAAGANALGVTIGTNFVFFPETPGSAANLDWTQRRIAFTATSSSTTVSFQDDTGANSDNSLVDNVVVGPPDYGVVLGAVTDVNGHYQIAVGNGTFQVGVTGLSLLGYNSVNNQSRSRSHSERHRQFCCLPLSAARSLPFPPPSVLPARATLQEAELSRRTARSA